MAIDVTVIIPAHNPTHFLRDGIASFLDDSQQNIEVLIIDDGSRYPVEPQIQHLPVRTIRTKKNYGPAYAQNVGLQEAKGRYLTFLDQDDLLAPRAVRWRLQWLKENNPYNGIMGAVAGIIDQRSQSQPTYRRLLKRRLTGLPKQITFNYVQKGGWIPLSPLSLCLFKREFLKRVGYFDESLTRTHDREYLYRILRHAPIPFINRSVLFYRLHDGNFSIQLHKGKILPHRRTLAELCLINLSHGLPIPH